MAPKRISWLTFPPPSGDRPALRRVPARQAHITPETSVSGGKADVRISTGEKTLVLVFVFRKNKWCPRNVEVRHGQQTDSFTRDELAKALAVLLGPQSPPSSKPVIDGASGPRTDAQLSEKRNIVIRV